MIYLNENCAKYATLYKVLYLLKRQPVNFSLRQTSAFIYLFRSMIVKLSQKNETIVFNDFYDVDLNTSIHTFKSITGFLLTDTKYLLLQR